MTQTLTKHKVFISYHHDLDQYYKGELLNFNEAHSVFIDQSVDTGSISDDLTDEAIRVRIRDDYLRDSTVTIVLVGRETKYRKHADWEIYSSMFDGPVNKRSGVVAVLLPSVTATYSTCVIARNVEERGFLRGGTLNEQLTPGNGETWRMRCPCLPARVADNLCVPGGGISVVGWTDIFGTPYRAAAHLRCLIETAFSGRQACQYDLRRPMMRRNRRAGLRLPVQMSDGSWGWVEKELPEVNPGAEHFLRP